VELPPLIVPLVTPYTDDGAMVSEIRIARMVRWHKEQGAGGFMVGSDAGEPGSLSLNERKQALEWVMREAGDLPVYVNISGMTTAYTIDLAQDANECGAYAGILTPPPWGGLTPEETQAFLSAVRRHGGLACGWIDPTGHTSGQAEMIHAPGRKNPGLLAEHGFEHLSTAPHGLNYEYWSPSGLIHPAGLFGAEKGAAMLEKWAAFKPVLSGLLKLAGPARVGKYVFESLGFEFGPLRGPYMPLNPQGREIADHLLRAV